MPGKTFASTPCLGTIRKGAIDAQRAINGQNLHRIVSLKWSKPLEGKAGCPVSFRKIICPVDAFFCAQFRWFLGHPEVISLLHQSTACPPGKPSSKERLLG